MLTRIHRRGLQPLNLNCPGVVQFRVSVSGINLPATVTICFWCSVESTGTVELGGNNQTNSLTTISGIISNGLDANSTSSVSVNSVVKNGSGTITLTGANTYTGSTSVIMVS